MDGLLSLLLFAGVFYLMMRFGCGAHMVHGGHGAQGVANAKKLRDPVCGMNVESDQGYAKMYQGREYRFCSRNCLDKFDTDAERYLKGEGGEP